ncbi:MAG: DNA (cytosine-5-)-methyltransferase [Treponema sp. CETP13]|nr:MAG: DNA (cytosine-5-)-methyltransferase [Treponema sp. CETP13]
MKSKKNIYSLTEFANLVSVSKETLRRWDKSGKLIAKRNKMNGYRYYTDEDLALCDNPNLYFSEFKHKTNYVVPFCYYKSIELFAGAGGLALGFEKAGLHHVLLNEIDKQACKTLRKNRPNWNVTEADIHTLDFTPYKNKIDVLSGGFPCQSFSYAGKRLGFNDARGTLFFEYARAIKETNPKICIGENVRGLVSHDKGRTLKGMINILEELGYRVLPPKILKAIYYNVPQKRERLVLVAIRNDIKTDFHYPESNDTIYTLKDALKGGTLYENDVPESEGQQYPKRKKEILDMVPPGGCWRNLPPLVQKEYMMKSYYLGGGRTGMARRIAWDEPSLTLTCSPAQKQTERCHPEETRPFTVREYARIQTFPDSWEFMGSMSQQYKQIGNAVPVNLAKELGYSVIDFLNRYTEEQTAKTAFVS